MNNTIRKFVNAVDKRPFSMAVATVATTTMTGMIILKATDNNTYVQERRPLTTREAHFRAMIEDAKESSWRENLKNAAMAQEQNMNIHGNQSEISNFVDKINTRSREILNRDQEYWRQKKEHENEQKLFATTTMW